MMMNMWMKSVCLTVIFTSVSLCEAQENKKISDSDKLLIIDESISLLHHHYVYPEKIPFIENENLRLLMPYLDKPISKFEWRWSDGEVEKVRRESKN